MPRVRSVEVNVLDPIAVRDEACRVPPAIREAGGELGALAKYQCRACNHAGCEPDWLTAHLPIDVPAEVR